MAKSTKSHLGSKNHELLQEMADGLIDELDEELEEEAKQGIQQPQVKHPSWRIYRAIQATGLSLADFGLKDCDIYLPYTREDDFIAAFTKILKEIDPNEAVAVKGGTPKFSEIDDPMNIVPCLELFLDLYGRQLLEGLILNNHQNSEIAQKLHCSEEFLVIYRELFFDTSVFKLESEKINYIQYGTVPKDHAAKMELLTTGAEYLMAKYGFSKQDVNVRNVLAEAFTRSYLQMVKYSDIDDLFSQDRAIAWANTLVKFAAELQKDKTSKLSLEDLVITLTSCEAPTLGIGDLK